MDIYIRVTPFNLSSRKVYVIGYEHDLGYCYYRCNVAKEERALSLIYRYLGIGGKIRVGDPTIAITLVFDGPFVDSEKDVDEVVDKVYSYVSVYLDGSISYEELIRKLEEIGVKKDNFVYLGDNEEIAEVAGEYCGLGVCTCEELYYENKW